MASADPDVEQLLSSRTATPITQLHPGLPDQAARKIHGEVTITWPYSSVNKSFAFLLAEPDFRLRRHKGLVRIQLAGPSAEAAGQWDLGSGDEVTLALDGVEWAKDDEPVRPAGSRSDWQLKFAGKLTLKATLGETHETKLLDIDQPVPVEAPMAVSPIPFAETDLALFASATPQAVNDEYASPVYLKRSRASYGPLFDLEEDGDRSSKRRKGLRYAAVNGTWTVQEGSRSPSPLPQQDSPAAAPEQDGDVDMPRTQDTTERTDGGVQTRDPDLAPLPSSPIDTPGKSWKTLASLAMTDEFEKLNPMIQHKARELSRRFSDDTIPKHLLHFARAVELKKGDMDAAYRFMVETFPSSNTSIFAHTGFSRPGDGPTRYSTTHPSTPTGAFVPDTEQLRDGDQQVTPSPFGQAFRPIGSTGSDQSVRAVGASAEHHESVATQLAPNLFRQASEHAGFARFGQPQDSAPSPNQGLGHASSLFGPSSTATSNAASGQASSLFGTGRAPTQPPFPHPVNTSTGLGAPSGSVRFGFGQEAQSSFGVSSFGRTEASTPRIADPYPESSLFQQENLNYHSTPSHIRYRTTAAEQSFEHRVEEPIEHEAADGQKTQQELSLWPMGTQKFDASHAVGRIHATEDLRSDGSLPEHTPPGMIPPAVDDGTRNVDEMRQEGILSRPVYRQGVPQEALPDHEHASAGEDGESMDSEERADYNEAEKGGDYDLRNYDRVADDEGDHEDDGQPFSDDDMLDEGSEHLAGEAVGYVSPGWINEDSEVEEEGDDDDDEDEDEDDYDEEEGEPTFAPPPPIQRQPPVQKQTIIEVIDLLSDSDDDEVPSPPRLQAPRNHIVPQETAGLPGPFPPDVVGLATNESDGYQADQEMDVGRTHESHNNHQHTSGTRQEAYAHDEEAKPFREERKGFSQDEPDDDDQEPDSGVQNSLVHTASRQPVFDLAASSIDEGQNEAQMQEASSVIYMPLDETDDLISDEERQSIMTDTKVAQGTHPENQDADVFDVPRNGTVDATAMHTEQQSLADESSGKKGGQEDVQHYGRIDDASPFHGADDSGAVDEQQEIQVRESQDSQEHQPEVQNANVINNVPSEATEDTMPMDTEQQGHTIESQGEGRDLADLAGNHEASPVSGSEHNVLLDSTAVDDKSPDNAMESFPTQPDNTLASFQSLPTAATGSSPPCPSDEDGDATMIDKTARETPQSQSAALEDYTTHQEPEKAFTEQPKAETESPHGSPEEDSMDMEAGEESVVEYQKTFTVEISLDDESDEPPSPPASQHPTHAPLNDQQQVLAEDKATEPEADLGFSRPSVEEPSMQQRVASEMQDREHEAQPSLSPCIATKEAGESIAEAADVGMADAAVACQDDDDMHQAGSPHPQAGHDMEAINKISSAIASEAVQEVPQAESHSDSSPLDDAEGQGEPAADEKRRLSAHVDESHSDEDEEFDDAPVLPTQAESSSAAAHEDGFVSVDSHASDVPETEETGRTRVESPKLGGSKMRTASAKPVRSTTGAKRGQRQASRHSYRQVSAQRVPSSQRTTRSKTMSFQAGSAKEDKEDLSIQAARAALKSPESKKRKASAPATKRPHTDMAKRLGKAMPNALPLMDLRKGINPAPRKIRPDFAAVVTSGSLDPKRTEIREYTSVFTVTDPSLAASGVVQVELFDKHKEFLPVVKAGDSILLRNMMVVSLRDRGFGLTSRSATGSSWAVFRAGGGDEPHMKTPVEMTAKDKKYMLDLRTWYEGLDEAAKVKVAEAAVGAEEVGKGSKMKK